MQNYNEKLAMFNECVMKDSFKDFSDGYHTFGELYHHRAILSSVIWNTHKDIAWKSKQHHNPDKDPMFEDMFIVGIETPKGQATYHYHLEYYDLFNVKELPTAPEWDGHTPDEAIERLEYMSRWIASNNESQ